MIEPPSGTEPGSKAGDLAPGEVPEQDQELDLGVPIDPRDVASAGRSCSVILILTIAIVLALCVGIALRWVILG